MRGRSRSGPRSHRKRRLRDDEEGIVLRHDVAAVDVVERDVVIGLHSHERTERFGIGRSEDRASSPRRLQSPYVRRSPDCVLYAYVTAPPKMPKNADHLPYLISAPLHIAGHSFFENVSMCFHIVLCVDGATD